MTKEQLEQYVPLKREVGHLQVTLDKLRDKEIPVVAGKVKASSKYFPFTEYRVNVPIEQPEIADRINKVFKLKEKRLDKCSKLMLEIEEFISSIEDSNLRQIFELRYLEGKKLREVADIVHLDLSTVSVNITRYLKCQTNQKNQWYNLN